MIISSTWSQRVYESPFYRIPANFIKSRAFRIQSSASRAFNRFAPPATIQRYVLEKAGWMAIGTCQILGGVTKVSLKVTAVATPLFGISKYVLAPIGSYAISCLPAMEGFTPDQHWAKDALFGAFTLLSGGLLTGLFVAIGCDATQACIKDYNQWRRDQNKITV